MATTAALLLAACSTSSDEPDSSTATSDDKVENVEIRAAWWGSDSRNAATVEALELYQDQNPNVTITSEYSPFSGYFDKLATLSAGGDAPDLFAMQYSFFPQYAANGQLLDLDQFSDVLDVSTVDEGVQLQGVVDGQRFAIPSGANTQAIIYDPAVFAAAGVEVPSFGWTWDDFVATGQALVDSGQVTYASNDFSGSDQLFDYWLTQHGKSFYTAEGTLGFTESDLVEFWEFFADLRDRSIVPPADVTAATTGDVATYPIVTGSAAMDFAYSTLQPGLSSAAGSELGLLPYPTGGSEPAQYLIGTGITWAGSATSDHPEVVADIIDFLVNDPGALAILGLQRGVPITQEGRDIVSDGVTEAEQTMINFIGEVAQNPLASESTFYNSPPLGANEVTSLFKTSEESVAFGKASIADAAADFISQAQDALTRAAG